MSPGATYLILLVAVAALATLRWPLVGVCSMLVIDFLRPQDFHPELGQIRPVAWLAIATVASTLWRDRGALSRSWRPLLPLLAVVAVAALSALSSDLDTVAWGAWVTLAKAALLSVLIVVHVDSRRRFEVALWCVAGSIAILSLAAIEQSVVLGYPEAWTLELGGIGGPPGPFSAQAPEGAGPIRDNNAFARLLVFGLPLHAALFLSARRRWARGLALVAGAATLAALMLTFSRAGFVAAVALAMLAVLQIRPRWKGAAVLVALVVVGYAVTPRIYHDRIASITLSDTSLRQRFAIWAEGLEMAASHPLLGVGIGTFTEHYARSAPPPPRSAHNVLVEVLAEMGALGLIAYLWLLGAAWWRLRRLAAPPDASSADWPAPQVATALSLALAGYMVASLTLSHAFSMHLLSGLALAFALTWRLGAEREPGRATRGVLPIEAIG